MITEEEENRWHLSDEMACYANTLFEEYIPDVDVEKKLLVKTPVPAKLDNIKHVDDFIISILGRYNQSLANDSNLRNFRKKFVMLWVDFQHCGKERDRKNSPDETIAVPIAHFNTLVEQTFLLLGQASNSITHKQHQNILCYLIKDSRKAKSLLQEKAALLQKHNENLFGRKFTSHITETEKSKKVTMEVFKSTSTSSPL